MKGGRGGEMDIDEHGCHTTAELRRTRPNQTGFNISNSRALTYRDGSFKRARNVDYRCDVPVSTIIDGIEMNNYFVWSAALDFLSALPSLAAEMVLSLLSSL